MTRPSRLSRKRLRLWGFGRCGFLGLLHMEIVAWNELEREFEVSLIATAPSVVYKVGTRRWQNPAIDNPSLMPDPTQIRALYEPYVNMDIHVPRLRGQRHGAVKKSYGTSEKSPLSGPQPLICR